jgi:plastocyanin
MKLLSSIMLLAASTSAMAGNLTGSIIFDKKPAFAGVLYVADGKSGPAKTSIDQMDKEFTSKLAVIGTGGTLEFSNSDSFQHNIFANDKSTGIKFDVGLMETGQKTEIKADWKDDTVTRVGCKIHPKMRTYVANIQSSAYQVFDFEKGANEYAIKFSSKSDSNEFVLMIPKYDELKFTLNPGEEKTLEITRKGKKKASITIKHS